jgi:hypothetical protein
MSFTNPKRSFLTDGLIIFSLVGLFVILKSFSFNPAVGDENIYFYDSWLMSRGFWPYKDFFFAHPPLHLIPGWIVMLAWGGFNLVIAKMLPMAASIVTGLCIYFIAKQSGGRSAAAVACVLFFFSHDLLRASSHWTGINWSVALMTGGLLAALRGKQTLSGILLALGICTGVYVAPGALIIILMLLLTKTKTGIRCAIAALITWLIVNGIFFLVGGQNYIDGVYRYHLLKPPARGSSLFDQTDIMLFHNFFLLASPIYFLPVLVGWICESIRCKTEQKNRYPCAGLWCVSIWLGYIVFLGRLSRVFHFYFLLLFPMAAVCGGLYISRLITHLRRAIQNRVSAIAAAVMLMAIGVGILIYPSFEHRLTYFERNRGKTKQYDFPRSPLPMIIQMPLKKLLWQPHRTIGKRYTGIQYYLWHESRDFDIVSEIADTLKDSVQADETIFGDSTSTPLVALLSGISIVDHFVDTNAMRFRCGLPSAEQAIAELQIALDRKQGRLNWILINPRRGLAGFEEFQQFFRERFKPFKTFRSRYHGIYQLMRQVDRSSEN